MRDGVVKTPPVVNILGGITRKTAMQILEKEGLQVQETTFGRDALYVADEVFMTGTAAEITPVREVDRRTVGPPGPVTKRVQQTYLDGVRGKVDWMKPFITTY
jgi:branched-chain amino acid aminotransferase